MRQQQQQHAQWQQLAMRRTCSELEGESRKQRRRHSGSSSDASWGKDDMQSVKERSSKGSSNCSSSRSTSMACKQRAQLVPALQPRKVVELGGGIAWRRPGGFLLTSSPQAGPATEEAPASLGPRLEQRASSRLTTIGTWVETAWKLRQRIIGDIRLRLPI